MVAEYWAILSNTIYCVILFCGERLSTYLDKDVHVPRIGYPVWEREYYLWTFLKFLSISWCLGCEWWINMSPIPWGRDLCTESGRGKGSVERPMGHATTCQGLSSPAQALKWTVGVGRAIPHTVSWLREDEEPCGWRGAEGLLSALLQLQTPKEMPPSPLHPAPAGCGVPVGTAEHSLSTSVQIDGTNIDLCLLCSCCNYMNFFIYSSHLDARFQSHTAGRRQIWVSTWSSALTALHHIQCKEDGERVDCVFQELKLERRGTPKRERWKERRQMPLSSKLPHFRGQDGHKVNPGGWQHVTGPRGEW